MSDYPLFLDADSLSIYAAYTEDWHEAQMYIQRAIRKMMDETGCNVLYGFLEHYGKKYNYRRQLMMTTEYKGGRSEKPVLTEKCKLLLHSKYGCTWASGRESEDDVSIAAHAYGLDKCVIGYVDHDLEQIAGNLYNYDKGVLHKFTELDAWRNYCHMMLIGCKGDRIQGLRGVKGSPGLGDKTAEKLLADATTEQELTDIVVLQYALQCREYRYMQEMAKMLRIQKVDDERFMFPVTEEEYYAKLAECGTHPMYDVRWASRLVTTKEFENN